MKRIISIILVGCLCCSVLPIGHTLAQNQIGALELQLQSASESDKVKILNQLSEAYLQSSPAKSLNYGNKALNLSVKLKLRDQEAQAFINIGNAYHALNNFSKAVSAYQKSLKINEEFSYDFGIAYNLNKIGITYKRQGDNNRAVEYYKKALEVYEKMGNKKGASYLLNNIGDIYLGQQEHENAVNYYKRALKLDREIKDVKGIASTLIKVGSSYSNWGNFEEALVYIREANQIAKANKLTNMINASANIMATVETNLASQGESKSQFELAEEQKMEEHLKEVEEENVKIQARASEFLKRIDQLSIENQVKELRLRVIEDEYERKLMIKKHEAQQRKRELALTNAELALKNSIIDKKNADILQKETERNALIGGLVLVLAFIFLLYNQYHVKRKANTLLEQLNEELARRNKQITASINYASRIQEAILPRPEIVENLLPESFIFYKPKSIVSGDFYWLKPNGDKIMFVAADCTGHGVPGAFMSIIGIDILNRVVAQNQEILPGEVLDAVNSEIISSLQHENAELVVKDGMDLVFCSLNQKTLELKFAGAQNSLYIVRNEELIEIKADKLFIGMVQHASGKKFTTHTIQLEKGDILYSFSDGFADQKGGVEGKKFYYPPFKKLLVEMHNKSMKDQGEHLDMTIKEWMGDREQIDDMLIFGIRV